MTNPKAPFIFGPDRQQQKEPQRPGSKTSYPIHAAHPRVAGLLTRIAENFADAARDLAEDWFFIGIGLVVAVTLVVCRANGWLQ